MKFSVVGFTHRGQSRTEISKSAFTDVFRHVCNIQNIVRRISLTTASNISMYMYNEDQYSFKHETDRVHTKCIVSSGKIGFTPLFFYLMVDIIYISDTNMDRQGYICTFYGLALSSESNLRQHENSKHKQAGPYVCCGKRYHSKANLCRHRCHSHNEKKQFKCSICEKAFATNTDLKRHQKREKRDWTYKCDICNQTFAVISKS